MSGKRIVVGSNSDEAASVYVFELDPDSGVWLEKAKLVPSRISTSSEFGTATSIRNSTIIISDYVSFNGEVYVFEQDSETGNWIEIATLVGSRLTYRGQFGLSVSFDGETLVAGAPRDNPDGRNTGSAYVFEKDPIDGVWEETACLLPSNDPYAKRFGYSVAVSGSTIVVGDPWNYELGNATGAAFVYRRSPVDGSWSEVAKLIASDATNGGEFGTSVDVDDDTIVVGAPEEDELGFDSGAAYLFVRDAQGLWKEHVKLLDENGEPGDLFGISLGISANQIAVGDFGDVPPGGSSAGSIHLFEADPNGVWTQAGEFAASDAGIGDWLGANVAIDGDAIVGGAHWHDHLARNSGGAYVFDASPLTMTASGACPGTVSIEISGAEPNSEVGVIAGTDNSGWVKGGTLCAGTVFEIGEPFQLPPIWIEVGESGSGSGTMPVATNRCWLEAISLDTCTTSGAVRVD